MTMPPPTPTRLHADLKTLLEELTLAALADDDGDHDVPSRVIQALLGRGPNYYPRGDPRNGLAVRLADLLRTAAQPGEHIPAPTHRTRADYEERITRLVADLCFDAQGPNGDRRSNRNRGREAAREILALLRPDLEAGSPQPSPSQEPSPRPVAGTDHRAWRLRDPRAG